MKFVVAILLSALFWSCKSESKIDLKFTDQPQVIACDSDNDNLLNEALYTFENDIITHFDKENRSMISAYGRFIYRGFSGNADYQSIASDHALQLRDAMLAEGILLKKGRFSNLNYSHPAVQCIIGQIEDEDFKNTIIVLEETSGMNPSLFNDRMRNFGRNAPNNRYQAVYVGLESYFQQLVNLPSQIETDE